MSVASRPTAILDACVLYPAPMRDLLLHIADAGLYQPKWTDQIQHEWTRNLLKNRPDLKSEQLQKTVAAMKDAFPDATVTHYEALIESIYLPDTDDRHVVAAAIRSHADLIITANLKDFPNSYLSQYDFVAQHPGGFVVDLMALNPDIVLQAFSTQVATLKKPPKTVHQVLEILRINGFDRTVTQLLTMV